MLGAIFQSRLAHELTRTVGAAAAGHVSSGGVDPAVVHHLPAPLRTPYLQAFATALHSVFLVAGVVTRLEAFVLSWFIPELPLRETVTTGDMGSTFAVPRDSDSLAEIANQIGRLDRREGAREIVRRVAARAGVDLSPAACSLLARYHEDATTDLPALATRIGIDVSALADAREELVRAGLVVATTGPPPAVELTAAGHATLGRLTATGEQRLADLLRDWRPEEHEELARLIVALARAFFIDTTALREHLAPAASRG